MVTKRTDAAVGHDRQDPLRACGLPVFFPISGSDLRGVRLPLNRHGDSVRVWARSLAGMQKEAIVASVRTGTAWRVASDEGPYLDGFDAAPCPLSFMTVGMVASYLNELTNEAAERGIGVRSLELVQNNRYTMEGSALKGTMIGGALPVDLDVRLDAEADDDVVGDLVASSVARAPVTALLRVAHRSRFALTVNGEAVRVSRVRALDRRVEPDPEGHFRDVRPSAHQTVSRLEPVRRVEAVETMDGVDQTVGSSLAPEQRRQLHVHAIGRQRSDGVAEVEQHLYRPEGSTFQFLCDEGGTPDHPGVAPDAASYLAAGLAFCFMTQLGRYATILKADLPRYRLVQDLHLGRGRRPGGSLRRGQAKADAVETHVYLETGEGLEFASQALDMAEQTCFLHALCRTPLDVQVTVTRR